MNYKIVPTITNVRRSFRIIVALREGYVSGSFVHQPIEAILLVNRWMKERAEANKPYLTGLFSSETLVYTWKGATEQDDAPEPAVVYQGEVSVVHNPDLTDGEVKEILNEVGALLGSELRQTRVYIAYRDEIWIIQAEGKFSPRAESAKHR